MRPRSAPSRPSMIAGITFCQRCLTTCPMHDKSSLMPDDASEPGPLGAAPEPGGEGVTVLVVDDERSNVESLEKIFVREGMRVLTAHDAKHALDQVRTHRVHVVLTDLMMPGTTGLELLRAVKQISPEVEVVL